MTNDIDKPSQELTTQQRAAVGKSAKGGITGRLKQALDLMIWQAMPWDQAAREVGMTVRNMRLSMNKPHVLAYLRRERGVRLVSGSAKNLARLEELRDQSDNITGAVQAAKTLEQMTSEAVGAPGAGPNGQPRAGWLIDLSGGSTQPGLQIVIVQGEQQPAGMTIDVTPNKDSAE
jgi:hypothetical protein